MSDITQATDQDFQAIINDKDRAVLVDFWAPWCGPCRAMNPVLEQMAHDHGQKLHVVKVNVDENPMVSQSFSVRSIPTMLVFKNGKPVKHLVGAMPKAQLERELRDWI